MLGFHFVRAQPGRHVDQACNRCWTSWPAGAITDHGRRRRKSALGELSALKFATYKFQVEQLQSVLESPLLAAWQRGRIPLSACGWSKGGAAASSGCSASL